MDLKKFRDDIRKKYGLGSVDKCVLVYRAITNIHYRISDMSQSELLDIILTVPSRKKMSENTSLSAYNIPTVKTLDILGGNVKKYLDEINLRHNFNHEYSKLYDRKNLTRIYNTYVKPLFDIFSLEYLRGDNINSTIIREWLEKNYKWSEDSINIFRQVANALNLNNSVIEIINSLDGISSDNVDIISLMKEKYKMKIDRRLLNSYIEELHKIRNGVEIPNMTYDLCLRYCINISTGRTLVETKIMILDVTNCPYVNKLLEEMVRRNETENYIDEIIASIRQEGTSVKPSTYHSINKEFGGLNFIPELSSEEIVKRFDSLSSHRVIAYSIIRHILRQNPRLIGEIDNLINPKYRSIRLVQTFRTSMWRNNLLDDIMTKHGERIQTTTAYYDSRYKKLEYDTVTILNFVNDHTKSTYSRQMNIDDPLRWFIGTCTIDMVKLCLLNFGKTRGFDNTRVKNSIHTHHAKRHIVNMMSMFNLIDTLPCHTELGSISPSEIINRIPDKRIDVDPNTRRTFTEDEVNRMLDNMKDDPVTLLMLTIFREIALRAGAVCNLKYDDIIDKYDNPKHICNVIEKGGKFREFVTSPNLKKKIVSYISHLTKNHTMEDIDRNIYIFGNNPKKPLAHSTLLSRLKKIAIDSKVTDVNVHPHAFRHTIVGVLMSEGNSADVVSKFMGHSSLDTTVKYYWIQTIEDLTRNLKNPFVNCKPSRDEIDDEIEILQTKLDSSLKIIDMYNAKIIEAIEKDMSAMELNQEIHKSIPDLVKLTKILQSLHESSVYTC